MKLPSLPQLGVVQILSLIAVAVLLVGLFALGWHFGAGRWKARYTALQASGWEQQAQAERAARVAIQGQLEAANATLSRNAEVMNELEQNKAALAADRDHTRDLVQRLLAEAARAGPRHDPVPETDRGSGTTEAGAAGSDERLASLLGDAAAECRGNADHLDALIGEIRPQL